MRAIIVLSASPSSPRFGALLGFGHALREVAGRDRRCGRRHLLDRPDAEPQRPERHEAQDRDHRCGGDDLHQHQSVHRRVHVAERQREHERRAVERGDGADAVATGSVRRVHGEVPRRRRAPGGLHGPRGRDPQEHRVARRVLRCGEHGELAVLDVRDVEGVQRLERRTADDPDAGTRRVKSNARAGDDRVVELRVEPVDEIRLRRSRDHDRGEHQHEGDDRHARHQACAQ